MTSVVSLWSIGKATPLCGKAGEASCPGSKPREPCHVLEGTGGRSKLLAGKVPLFWDEVDM